MCAQHSHAIWALTLQVAISVLPAYGRRRSGGAFRHTAHVWVVSLHRLHRCTALTCWRDSTTWLGLRKGLSSSTDVSSVISPELRGGAGVAVRVGVGVGA